VVVLARLTLDASPGVLELVTTCDEEVSGGKCSTEAGPVTTKFTVSKGKVKTVSTISEKPNVTISTLARVTALPAATNHARPR